MMRTRRSLYQTVILTVQAALAVTACVDSGKPLPPLIEGASAGGGWDSACPPLTEEERQMIQVAGRIAVSPELEWRLAMRFPPGTSNAEVIAVLQAQGFALDKPCPADHSIQRANFYRKSDVASATIYWKLDDRQRVVWTKGIVFHDSL